MKDKNNKTNDKQKKDSIKTFIANIKNGEFEKTCDEISVKIRLPKNKVAYNFAIKVLATINRESIIAFNTFELNTFEDICNALLSVLKTPSYNEDSKQILGNFNGCDINFDVVCTISAVNKKLKPSEIIVGEFNNFTYNLSDKSIIGNKYLYITNLGNLISYDEGGLFADSKSTVWSSIEYSFLKDSCKFQLSPYLTRIKATISIKDYLKLSLKTNNFLIDYTSLPAIMYTNNNFSVVDINYTNDSFTIIGEDNKKFYVRFIKSINFQNEW